MRSLIDQSRAARQAEINAERSVVQPEPAGVTAELEAVRFRTKEVFGDYLRVRRIDASKSSGESDTDEFVARHPEIRLGTFVGQTLGDGNTYAQVSVQSITATSGTTVETWVVNPPYRLPSGAFKGGEIIAVKVRRGTGVSTSGGSPKPIVWIEVSARAWAKVGD